MAANYGYAVPHQRQRHAGKIDPKTQGPGLLRFGPMLGWWRADDITTPDNVAITSEQWRDRSGSANPLSKFHTTGPIVKKSYLNGRDWLLFSTNNHMKATTRVAPLTGFTIFLVIEWNGGRVIGLENSSDGSKGLALYNNSLWIIRDGGTYDIGFGYSGKMIAAISLGAGGAVAWRNGVIVGTNAHTSYGDAGVNFTIGGSGTNDSSLGGLVATAAIFSPELSAPTIGAVFTDLNAYYGGIY